MGSPGGGRGSECATPYAPTAATTLARITICDHLPHRDAFRGLVHASSACPLHALRSFRVRKLQLVTPARFQSFLHTTLAQCIRNYESSFQDVRSGRAGPILSVSAERMQSPSRGGNQLQRSMGVSCFPPLHTPKSPHEAFCVRGNKRFFLYGWVLSESNHLGQDGNT